MNIFSSSIFITVLLGTMLLGVSSAMVGTISVIGKKSLLGDALSHSSFPGVIIAFILFQSRYTYILLLGAAIFSLISYYVINIIEKSEKVKSDSQLAIVLSGFFGLGMMLKSYIQGRYTGASQAGISNYIFGQAAFMKREDVYIALAVSILSLIIIILFYKEIKLYLFDREFFILSGYSKNLINTLIILMTVLLLASGLKAVGSILISSMLIAPAVAALEWSHDFKKVIILSGVFGGVSAFLGTIFSTFYNVSTGPSIVIFMSIIVFVSIFKNILKRKKPC